MARKWSEMTSKEKKLGIGCLSIIVIFAVLIGVIVAVASGGGKKYDDQITAVQNSMTNLSAGSIVSKNYEAGDLEDGVAVLVSDMAAYWVKDDVVYAANGIAKTWSPLIDYAPTGIDLTTVENAVS